MIDEIIKNELENLQGSFKVVANNYASALSDCREASNQVSDLIKYIKENSR